MSNSPIIRKKELAEGVQIATKIKELIFHEGIGARQLRTDHNAFVVCLLKEARDLYERKEK